MTATRRLIHQGTRLVRRLFGSNRRPTKPTSTTEYVVAAEDYPGDFTGTPNITYEPIDDDLPDPGEVVWTWIPFEEDHSQGKDRPALIIGRDGRWLLALQVTSQDHDLDAAQEAGEGRYWEDIGTGDWDRRRRPSEVRVNRIVRIDPAQVRRIGAVLSQDVFNRVTTRVAEHFGPL